jgi:Prefoldin subunit
LLLLLPCFLCVLVLLYIIRHNHVFKQGQRETLVCSPASFGTCRVCVGCVRQRGLEGLDDAGTELMMGGGDNDNDAASDAPVMIYSGEAFFETSEDDAVAFCESETEKLQARLDQLVSEQEEILSEQEQLKQILYARFGKSINLD